MTDQVGSAFASPSVPSGAPAVVWVAAVVTWVTAGATVLLSAVLTAGALFLGGPVADALEVPYWWWWVVVVEAGTLACCGCAAVLAWGVLRGSKAARWGLIASSTITAVVGAMTVYFIWTGVVALAALVVMALLSLPSTGDWTRATDS